MNSAAARAISSGVSSGTSDFSMKSSSRLEHRSVKSMRAKRSDEFASSDADALASVRRFCDADAAREENAANSRKKRKAQVLRDNEAVNEDLIQVNCGRCGWPILIRLEDLRDKTTVECSECERSVWGPVRGTHRRPDKRLESQQRKTPRRAGRSR